MGRVREKKDIEKENMSFTQRLANLGPGVYIAGIVLIGIAVALIIILSKSGTGMESPEGKSVMQDVDVRQENGEIITTVVDEAAVESVTANAAGAPMEQEPQTPEPAPLAETMTEEQTTTEPETTTEAPTTTEPETTTAEPTTPEPETTTEAPTTTQPETETTTEAETTTEPETTTEVETTEEPTTAKTETTVPEETITEVPKEPNPEQMRAIVSENQAALSEGTLGENVNSAFSSMTQVAEKVQKMIMPKQVTGAAIQPERPTEVYEVETQWWEAPTEAPTQTPTEVPTEAPTEASTEAPTQTPTEAPTQAPTEAPTEAPTQAPTEAPYFPRNSD